MEGKVELLLGKGMEGICNKVVEECVVYLLGRWWQRKKQMYSCCVLVLISLVSSLPPEQLDTVYSF